MKKVFVAIIILVLSFAAQAQKPPTKYNLQADQVTTIDNHTFTATGNVILKADDMTITGDNVTYNKANETVKATGNVTLKSPTQTISASEIDYDLVNETGTIYDVEGFLAPINYLCAKKLERTGPTTFKVYDARISTCFGEIPDWSVSMYTGTLELEGYLSANHATTDILNTPLIYLPKFIYPVSTKRQSGFLIPGIGTMSDRGAYLSLEYYWAPTINFDATLGVNLFTKSGIQQLIELRYAHSPKDSFYASFERIEEIDSEVTNGVRWRAVTNNNYYIFDNLEINISGDEVSDYLYSRDFFDLGISSYNAENKENVYFQYGGINFFSQFADIELKYRKDMEFRDTRIGYNKTILEQLPSISISKVIAPLPFLGVSYDVSYDRITDNATSYDLITDNNSLKKKYTNNEYDRFYAEAKIYSPIDLKFLTITPSIGVNYTSWKKKDGEFKIKENVHTDFGEVKYGSKDNSSVYRLSGEINATIALRELYKKYGSFTHGIENVLELSYIPKLDQKGIPNLLDSDFIEEQALVSYKMINYLKAKRWSVTLTLTQGYNGLKEDNSTLPLEIEFLTSAFGLTNTFNLTYKHSGKFDEEESALKKMSDTLNFQITKNFYILGEYSYIPLAKNSADSVYNSSSKVGFGGKIKTIEFEAYNTWQAHAENFDLSKMVPLEQFVSVSYITECWGVGLEGTRKNYNVNTRNGQVKRQETTIYLKFILTGLGDSNLLFYKDNNDKEIQKLMN